MYIQKQLIPPPKKKTQHVLIIWPLYNNMGSVQAIFLPECVGMKNYVIVRIVDTSILGHYAVYMSSTTSLHGTASVIFSNIAVGTYNVTLSSCSLWNDVCVHAWTIIFVSTFFMAFIYCIGSNVPEDIFYWHKLSDVVFVDMLQQRNMMHFWPVRHWSSKFLVFWALV